MSYTATHWAWDLEIPGTEKLIMLALADMADENNSCYPGQERLARMAQATTRTVRRALASLEATGYISRSHRYRDDGYRTSDRFFLNVGFLPDKLSGSVSEPEAEPCGQNEHALRTSGATLPDIGVRLKEPPENHQIEPPEVLSAIPLEIEVEPEPPKPEPVDYFAAVWEHWPKSDDRKLAQSRWPTAVKAFHGSEAELAAIAVEHGDAYRAYRTKQFTPALAVWLNKQRWDNELPAPDIPRGTISDAAGWSAPPTRMQENLAILAQMTQRQQMQEQQRPREVSR